MGVIVRTERSAFHTIDNLSIAIYAFATCMLTLLSFDETLLYVKWSTNFRGLPLKVEMVLSGLKHIDSVLFAFALLPSGYATGIWLGQKR